MADCVFILQPYGGAHPKQKPFSYVVIVPEGVTPQQVTAAWAYAVRYTARGLDLPDHDAALKMFQERHPSWTIINSTVQAVQVNLALADQDVPENG